LPRSGCQRATVSKDGFLLRSGRLKRDFECRRVCGSKRGKYAFRVKKKTAFSKNKCGNTGDLSRFANLSPGEVRGEKGFVRCLPKMKTTVEPE